MPPVVWQPAPIGHRDHHDAVVADKVHNREWELAYEFAAHSGINPWPLWSAIRQGANLFDGVENPAKELPPQTGFLLFVIAYLPIKIFQRFGVVSDSNFSHSSDIPRLERAEQCVG